MSKFSVVIWYAMVLINVVFLVFSMLFKNATLAACAFFMAMWLSKNYYKVPLPKIYEQLMFQSRFKGKK